MLGLGLISCFGRGGVRRLFVVSCVVVTVLSVPGVLLAQEHIARQVARARGAFDRGTAAFDRELYAEAEDAFNEAYSLLPASHPPRPLVLFNIAQSVERQGGRDLDALTAWQRFREEAAGVAEPEHLQRADERIRELRLRQERRERGDQGLNPWGLSLIGVGSAMVVAGIVVGAIGLVEREDIVSSCAGTVCPIGTLQRASQLETYGLIGDVLLWPGLAVAAVGAVLTIVLSETGDLSTRVSFYPGGLAVRGTW